MERGRVTLPSVLCRRSTPDHSLITRRAFCISQNPQGVPALLCADPIGNCQREHDPTIWAGDCPGRFRHGRQGTRGGRRVLAYSDLDRGCIPQCVPIDSVSSGPVVNDVSILDVRLDLAPVGWNLKLDRADPDIAPTAARKDMIERAGSAQPEVTADEPG